MRALLASCWCHLLINRDLHPCSGSQTQTTLGKMIWDFRACICKMNRTTVQAHWTVVPKTFQHFSQVSEYCITHVVLPSYQNAFADQKVGSNNPDPAPGMRAMSQHSFCLSGLLVETGLCQTLTAAVRTIPAPARDSQSLGQPQPGYLAPPWGWGSQSQAGQGGFGEQQHHQVRGWQLQGLRVHANDGQLNLCATL